jgi:hypothetical protein
MSSKNVPKLEAIQAELSKTVEEIREDLQTAMLKNPNLFGAAVIELKLQDGVVTNAQATLTKQRRPK